MRDLVHDALSSLFSYDAKLWRTLSILIRRPGQLTVDFVEGRRARYLSPLQLFAWLQAISFAAHQAFFDPRAAVTHNKSIAILILGFFVVGGLWASDARRKNSLSLALLAGIHGWSFSMVVLLVEYTFALPVSRGLTHLGLLSAGFPLGQTVTLLTIVGYIPYLFLANRRVYADSLGRGLLRTALVCLVGFGGMWILASRL